MVVLRAYINRRSIRGDGPREFTRLPDYFGTYIRYPSSDMLLLPLLDDLPCHLGDQQPGNLRGILQLYPNEFGAMIAVFAGTAENASFIFFDAICTTLYESSKSYTILQAGP